MRSLASNYCTEFLQCVAALLSGSAEGNAVISGETLEEERRGHGDAAWRSNTNLPIPFKGFFCFLFLNVLKIDCLKKKGEVDVPLAGAKLYGGQQLERLLAEFLAVSSRAEIAEPSLADVANAAGLNKVRYGGTCFVKKAFFKKKKKKNLKSNSTDLAWSASDLAQHKSKVRKLFLFWNFFFFFFIPQKDAFAPLVRNLASRAAYILRRCGDIARRIIDNRRRLADASAPPSVENVDDATK